MDLILQDYGENVVSTSTGGRHDIDTSNATAAASAVAAAIGIANVDDIDQFNTGASEAARGWLTDVLEFVADLHVLAKLKVSPDHHNVNIIVIRL